MTHTNDQWHAGCSPDAEGIFYPDDSFRPITFHRTERSLVVGERSPLPANAVYLELRPYESGNMACPHGTIRWGGGPWEGEGWISLEDSAGDLTWILHIEDCEPITQARFEIGFIETVAYAYPQMAVFLIPIFSPHEASMSTERKRA